MKPLPKHIKDKIRRIVKKTLEIDGLIRDINEWNPKLREISMPPNNWTWDQYFFGNNEVWVTRDNIEAFIEGALERIEKQQKNH